MVTRVLVSMFRVAQVTKPVFPSSTPLPRNRGTKEATETVDPARLPRPRRNPLDTAPRMETMRTSLLDQCDNRILGDGSVANFLAETSPLPRPVLEKHDGIYDIL